jgi:hypothetical protein
MDQNAPDGLVIDLRNNPGGDVEAAEQMLQMLVAKQVEPARFHLANTPAMVDVLRNLKAAQGDQTLSAADRQKLANAIAELRDWLPDADQQPLPDGPPLTSGKPLTNTGDANKIGQIYHGRGVAVLINSLTYSAADVFTAGFQDHGGGILLGPSLVTGGGGANVWTHDDLLQKIGPHPALAVEQLPGDASLSFAVRRCSRVGPFEGQPVEDQGVKVDIFYESQTVDDLIAGQPGLVRRACEELFRAAVFRIDAPGAALKPDGSVTVNVQTVNIESLKFYLNGNAVLTLQAKTGAVQNVTLPAPANGITASVLRIEGYSTDTGGSEPQLVRSRRIPLQAAPVKADLDPVTQSITGTDPAAAQ